MSRWLAGLPLLLLPAAVPARAADCSPPRTRVVVATLADRTDGVWSLWTGQGVGDGLASLLCDSLANDGLRVRALPALPGPQAVLAAARAGGAEVLVTGEVTRFGYEDRSGPGRFLRWGITDPARRTAAVVAIELRAVDPASGEVLFETHATRERVAAGSALAGDQQCFADRQAFDDALVGGATRDVLEALAETLQRQLAMRWSARVTAIARRRVVVLDAGESRGLEPGARLTLWRAGIQVFDPEQGPIGAREARVGELVVAGWDGPEHAHALARVISGDAAPGDIVRPCDARVAEAGTRR